MERQEGPSRYDGKPPSVQQTFHYKPPGRGLQGDVPSRVGRVKPPERNRKQNPKSQYEFGRLTRIMPRFLTAQWRYLAMLNYTIDRAAPTAAAAGDGARFFQRRNLREPGRLPLPADQGLWPGHPLAPRLRGGQSPLLRPPPTMHGPDGWRRGVAFVGELVPRRAIAFVARRLYGEPYTALPMGHRIQHTASSIHVEYRWQRERQVGVAGRLGPRPAATLAGRFPRGVHRRALLGLHGPPDGGTVRQRVPGRASPVADLVRHGELPARRRLGALRRVVRRGPFRPARFDLHRRGSAVTVRCKTEDNGVLRQRRINNKPGPVCCPSWPVASFSFPHFLSSSSYWCPPLRTTFL